MIIYGLKNCDACKAFLKSQPDFELIAFDFVSNPSTHGAFLSPVNEGKTKTKDKTAGDLPETGINNGSENLESVKDITSIFVSKTGSAVHPELTNNV